MRTRRLVILLSCLVAAAVAAEETGKLPDPCLEDLFIGDDQLKVEAALRNGGWETSDEWYNTGTDPIYRLRGEMDNRKLLYEFDVYGRLYCLTYLEQWNSIDGCNDAFATWSEWLKLYYGEPGEEDKGQTFWITGGYDIRIYNQSFIAGESTMPTVMITIFPVRVP
jgi:hypothetical protein